MSVFTFGIITDTHIRSPKGDRSSPFPVNERSNGRARYAARLLASHDPELVIHLGDMVHPQPHMQAYGEAAQEARRLLAPVWNRMRAIPGNHDIGDKPSPGMPAKASSTATLQVYKECFGEDHWSFEHKGIVFAGFNASLVNSGLPRESEQKNWLETTLRNAAGRRIFLFSHYPPFILHAGEQDHYDNYSEPGRSWLLGLAAECKVEALISGHVHHFFYNRYKDVKLFCLPPTSFTRQDYAEMFPLSPEREYGRDDRGKFGVALIDIGEDGFSLRWLDTGGQELAADQPFDALAQPRRHLPLIPHLRHEWYEPLSLPYNGPMEEFTRKRLRNDYPLLRLMQFGIECVRLPLSDLLDPKGYQRMADWAELGFRFVLFKLGPLCAEEKEAIAQATDWIEAVELLCVKTGATDLRGELDDTGAPLWLSKVTTSADTPSPDGVFSHAVSSGFLLSQSEKVLSSIEGTAVKGLTLQLPWGDDPTKCINSAAPVLAASGLDLILNIRLAHPNPAIANFDETSITECLRTAVNTASKHPNVRLQCDTFEDVDRGYNPRMGMIDRRCNVHDWMRDNRSALTNEEIRPAAVGLNEIDIG